MLSYQHPDNPVVVVGGIKFTKCNGSFSQALTERLVKASDRSGVTISLLQTQDHDSVILCIEKGREEDYWAAFR
jgi:hypothetical protein